MDGIGLPIAAFLFGSLLCLIFAKIRPLKQFALAALVSPFLSSIVFLFGSWVLSDMNPCAEYGSSCVPPGGHEATRLDVSLWLLSVAVTFLLSALACPKIQKALDSRAGAIQELRLR
jgi:hypothetical protein